MEFESVKDFYELEKKSDASQKNQRQFQELFLVELQDNGINDEMVINTLNCVGLGSGYAVFTWLNGMESEQLTTNFDTIIENKVFKKNEQRNSLKLLCSILSKNFCGNCNPIIVERIVKIIQSFAINKTGKFVGDLENIFLRYFIDGMGLHVSPFEWDKINCNEDSKKTFCKFLKTALSNEKCTKRSEEQIRRIDIIMKWITCVLGNENEEKQMNQQNETKTSLSFGSKNRMSDNLKEIAEYIELLEQENKDKSREIVSLTQKLEIEKQNSNRLLEAKHETEKSLTEKKELAAQLSQNIENLKEDIDKRDNVLTVFQADKKESETEKMNAIAAELKVYFSDFQDAKDMEMNAEIGDFLCDTLESIFDVLKKNGIDVTV